MSNQGLSVKGIAILVFGVVLSFGSVIYAQVSSGVVLGTVRDASGAVIPGVALKVTDTNTGVVHETISNESGAYRIEPLPPGPYRVEADLTGFKTEVRTITLNIEPARVDFTLVVGEVSEVVNVQGEAPILQTDDSAIGQLVDERKIVDLPLNGRDFSQLTYIVPGAYAPRPNSNLGYRGGFSIQGQNENTNQYLLDGIAVNSPGIFEVAIHMNLDAVGEFKVQTSNYDAEYGRFSGGQVDFISKSGTNDLHGDMFGFLRNSALGQNRNFFDPYPRTYNSGYRRGQYGAVLGGPIVKNKTFFFVGYQGQRQQSSPIQTITVPQPQFFTGDLSALPGTIKDPMTGQPFQGNIIPQKRLSPISLEFQQFWPSPANTWGTSPIAGAGLTNNYRAILTQPDNFNQENGKIDHELTPRQHVSLAYTLNEEQFVESESSPSMSVYQTQGSVKAWTLNLGHVYTVSPQVINEVRVGGSDYQRGRYETDLDRSQNWDAILGITGVQSNPGPQFPYLSPDPIAFGVPYVTITGYAELGNPYSNPQPRKELAFTARDVFSLNHGSHSLKFGVDWLAWQVNQIHETNARGAFSFTGGVTGNAMADFLLGLPSNTSRDTVFDSTERYPRKKSIDFFVQDSWRVRPTLTLSYGVRLEDNFAMHEKYGHLGSYDPAGGGIRVELNLNNITDPRDQVAINTYRSLYPNLPIYTGTYVNNNLNRIAPRFGFAYSPAGSSNTAIRGGVGLFYQIQSLTSGASLDSAPFVLAQSFTTADNITFANPWGNGRGDTVSANETIDPNEKDPYYLDWNLDIQHQLPGGWLLDTSYLGKHGMRLIRSRDINQPLNLLTGIRPISNFSSISYSESTGDSIYHGMVVRSEKRASNGLTYLFTFAYSKLIDDLATPQNSYNQKADTRGVSSDSDKLRGSLSLVYQLPFGREQRFMAHAPEVVDALFGGWQLSGISRANSGYRFTATISTNNSGTADNHDRPNLTGNPNLGSASKVQDFWNKNAFAIAPAHSFGNEAPGMLVGPSFFATDATFAKILRPRESQQVQVRLEFYNIFNHPNFNDPATTFNAATFGSISSTINTQNSSIGDAREFQMALKWIF